MDFVAERDNGNFSKVENSPLLFYTLSYITGILASPHLNLSPILAALTALITTISVLPVLFLHLKYRSTITVNLLKILLFASMLMAGNFNNSIRLNSVKNKQISLLTKEKNVYLKLTVKNSVKISRNNSSALCFSRDYKEKVLLFFKKEYNVSEIETGDTIALFYTGYPVDNLKNENNEGWIKHLKRQDVKTFGYVSADNSHIIKSNNKTTLQQLLTQKSRLLKKIEKSDKSGKSTALISAITTGDKSYLGKEVKDAFSASGSMHMMAVSGFHVSLIYLFISWLLSFMGNFTVMKLLRATVVISILWIYIAIAGFSPSAVRSALMLSIHIIGGIFSKRDISLNSLCASALLITLADPGSLYDPGFQLSYTAFLSIIFISPVIRGYMHTDNKLIKKLWNIISVTLACQIGTSLISVNLFGYIPVYFLLSNLLILPLVTIIICLSLLSVICITSGINTDMISAAMNFLADIAFGIASRIESLPCSVIKIDPGRGAEISLIVIILLVFIDFGTGKLIKRYAIAGAIINILLCWLL